MTLHSSKIMLFRKGYCLSNIGGKNLQRLCVSAAVQERESIAAKSLESMPGFKRLPFIGNAWIYMPLIGKYKASQLHVSDLDKYHNFGDIVKDQFGSKTIVTCYGEEDLKTLLRNESKTPDRGQLATLLKYREERQHWYKTPGVILMKGEDWHSLRFRLQRHLMKPRIIDRYVGPITEISHALINRLQQLKNQNNEVPDVMTELFKWAFESVSYVGLEKRIGSLDSEPSAKSQKAINGVRTALACMAKLEAFGGNPFELWKKFKTPTWRKFTKAMDYFSEMAYQEVQRTTESLRTNPPQEEQLTLLQAILSAGDVEPHEVMTMVMDLMFAGIDTTSNSTGFLLYHLAKNPDKQEKLYRDIVRVLPTSADILTAEVLNDMRYLKLCIKESMRLHTVTRGITRVIDKDLTLSGYHVPKGTMCFLAFQTCGRLEKYFPDADRFIPERWDDTQNKPLAHTFLPFGFGIRSCLGRRVAELEMNILTIEILRRFKVEYRQEDFELFHKLVNTPDRPLRFAFIERE